MIERAIECISPIHLYQPLEVPRCYTDLFMAVICIVERIVLKTVSETGTSGALFIAEVRNFLLLFKTKQLPPPFSFPLLPLTASCH